MTSICSSAARPDIGISDGKFVALGANLSGSATEEIDAHDLAIFPGVIDAHVHFNEPGRTDWEGFATGSRAAAAGGTTTIFDMPLNAHPPTIDGESFDAETRRSRRESRSSISVSGADWSPEISINSKLCATAESLGLKAFMCNSGIDDFPRVDRATLREGMRRAAELGLLVAVHAESEEMTSTLTGETLRRRQNASPRLSRESRPIAAELEAIRSAIDLAGETGCRLHIVHVSCGSGRGDWSPKPAPAGSMSPAKRVRTIWC